MKTPRLFLVRHANSSRRSPDGTDASRPLTVGGTAAAGVLGKALARWRPAGGPVLSSPAQRCMETARAIAAAAGEGGGPPVNVEATAALELGANVDHALALVRRVAPGSVLVGHQPGLLGLVAALLAEGDLAFDLPVASVVGLFRHDQDGVRWTLALAARSHELDCLLVNPSPGD